MLGGPGGKVEPGESIETALERELHEELGILPAEYMFIQTTEVLISIKGWELKPFLITKWSGTVPAQVLDEKADLCWMEIDKVQKTTKINTTKQISKAIKVLLKL